MKQFLTLIAFFLLFSAQAQTRVLTEEQYHTLWKMTRMQADTLRLNEYEYIKLLRVNRMIMLQIWEEVEQKWAKKEEEVYQINPAND